jgi:hypothetical protein
MDLVQSDKSSSILHIRQGDEVLYRSSDQGIPRRVEIVQFFLPDSAYVHLLGTDGRFHKIVQLQTLSPIMLSESRRAGRCARLTPDSANPLVRNLDLLIIGAFEIDV